MATADFKHETEKQFNRYLRLGRALVTLTRDNVFIMGLDNAHKRAQIMGQKDL